MSGLTPEKIREVLRRFLVAGDARRSDQPNTPYVNIMGPTVDDVEAVLDAARRYADALEHGIVIVPEVCKTCEGRGVFTGPPTTDTLICRSCEGHGVEWPERALDAMRQVTERMPPWEALDALHKAMRENQA